MAKLIQYATKASQYDGAFDSRVGWSAAGMGYLLITDNGHVVVIDGGFDNDAEELLSLIKRETGKEKPTVDLWIITHPHGDHYFALRRMASDNALRSQIAVMELVCRFPEEYRDAAGNSCKGDILEIQRAASYFGATIRVPQTDEHLSVGGLDIHFLYTPEELSGVPNANQLSLIFAVTGGHKRAIFTGDAFHNSLNAVTERYLNRLHADILQIPHHGLCDTGHLEFYKQVDAKIVLIPISIAGDRSMHSDMYDFESRKANLFAEENAARVYKAFEGNAELEI